MAQLEINTVTRSDGYRVRVAPSSLKKHGLKDGQTLTKEQTEKISWTLAHEWLRYAAECKGVKL